MTSVDTFILVKKHKTQCLLIALFTLIFTIAVFQRGNYYNSDSIRYLSEAGFLGSFGHVGSPVSEFMRKPLHAFAMAIPMLLFGANDNTPYVLNYFAILITAVAIFKISEIFVKKSGFLSANIFLFSGYVWAYGFSLMSELNSIMIAAWAIYFAMKAIEIKKINSYQSYLFILLMGMLVLVTSRWILVSVALIGLYEILFIIHAIVNCFGKIKDFFWHYFGTIFIIVVSLSFGIFIYFLSSRYIFSRQLDFNYGISDSYIHALVTLVDDFGSSFQTNPNNLMAFFNNATFADNILMPILFSLGVLLLVGKIIKSKQVDLLYLLLFLITNLVFFSFYHSDKLVTPLAAPRFFALLLPIYYVLIGSIIGYLSNSYLVLNKKIILIILIFIMVFQNREMITTRLLKIIANNINHETVFAYITNPVFSATSPVVLKNNNFISIGFSPDGYNQLSNLENNGINYFVFQDYSGSKEFNDRFKSNLPFFQSLEKFQPEKTVEIPIDNFGKLIMLEHFSYTFEKDKNQYPKYLRIRFYKISDILDKKNINVPRVLTNKLIIEGEKYDNIEGTCRAETALSDVASQNQYFVNDCSLVNYVFEVKEKGKYQLNLSTINQENSFSIPYIGVDNTFNIVDTNYNHREGQNVINIRYYNLEPGIHRLFTAIRHGDQIINGSFGIDYFSIEKSE